MLEFQLSLLGVIGPKGIMRKLGELQVGLLAALWEGSVAL